MGKLVNAQELRGMLPYIPSMILVDKVFLESETRAIAQKCVTITEQIFLGHFPGHPIMPGVMQVEAIVQTAEVLLRSKLDPELKYDFYLQHLRRVKFRKPGVPGDRLLIEVDVTEIRADSAEITAVIKNGAGVVSNAQMTVAVRPKVYDDSPIRPFNEFDRSIQCAMENTELQKYLPHRFPFLMVDYVNLVEGSHVRGIKNIAMGEPVLRTYSDGYSVLANIYQIEIAAQAGAIYMLSNEHNKGKLALFMGIEDSVYHCPIFPGQQLRLEMDMPDTKSKFGKGKGCVFADDKLASETCMLFAIVDP